MIELWDGDVDCVVFLQTIEHVQDPDAVLARIRELIGRDGVAYVSTPNVLTLAPEGAERSGNPWHVQRVPRRGVPRPVRAPLRLRRAARAVPRAQAARPPGRDRAPRLGLDPRRAADHQAVLRPLHAGDLRARLRAALRARPRPRAGLPRGPAAVSGRLSIVLHTHMPYVEGFGTWPFGEEWLWEAMATSYLPLLDVLDARPGRVTLSLTPVLRDQLEADGAAERFLAFLREIRPRRTASTSRRRGGSELAGELERSAELYSAAAERFEARGRPAGRVRAARAGRRRRPTRCCRCWPRTPACACSWAPGSPAHGRASATGSGGLWLPECAHAPWLDPLLEEAGVRAACVDLTDVLGYGDTAQLRPLRTAAGPAARADRPRADGPRVERAATRPRAPTATPPPHRAPPHAVGGRRRALRPARAAASSARTPPSSRTRPRGGSRAAGWRSARWTPSCSATGGTRASTGSPRWIEAATAGVAARPLDDARRRRVAVAAGGAAGYELGRAAHLATWSGRPRRAGGVRRAAELRSAAECGAGHARGARAAGPPGCDWAFRRPAGPRGRTRASARTGTAASSSARSPTRPDRARARTLAPSLDLPDLD